MSPSKHLSMKMVIGIYVQLFTSSSECSSFICSYAICWRDIFFCSRKLAVLKHYGVTILNCQFGKNAITRLCQLIFGKYVVLYMRRNHTAPPLEKRLTRGGPPHNDKKNTGGQHPEIPTPELRLRAPPPQINRMLGMCPPHINQW